ncbi:MAG TPA: FmdB family zinc ribbon protein [Verrucomicrobiae bacterium]|nr:FmdB family zinc ribbon protein [Verrucomicrobiae bacterium]
MPIYDYRCDECGHRFSAVQSFSEGPIEKCPNCGKRPRRLITTPAIVFKGSGWYKTDSRGKAPSEAGEPAKTESKTDTKSDTKSDAKSGTKTEPKTESKPAADAKPPAKSEAKS